MKKFTLRINNKEYKIQAEKLEDAEKIKVNIDVSYGSTVTGNITITPVVTGELIGAYLYEEGTDYGSTTLDKQVIPKVSISSFVAP